MHISTAILLGTLCSSLSCGAQEPFFVRAENSNGPEVLNLYSTADYSIVEPVLQAYVDLNPGIEIAYYDLQSQDLFERVFEESQTADLVWSSAMDLQMKLVNDGFAQRVDIPSRNQLPNWAVWRDEAFAISVEPAVMVYNRELINETDVPVTRGELLDWLQNTDQGFGSIGTYDIERSGLGTLLVAHDAAQSSDFWDLMVAMGQNQVSLFSSSSALIERVVDGRLSLAYNVVGSYAAARAQNEPQLGVILPIDYTLLVSRIAFVPAAATNARLGKELLSFLLSEQGQKILNYEVGFPATHNKVSWTQALFPDAASERLALDPLPVDTSLLVYLDRARRDNLIRQWREALNGAL